MFFYLFSRLLWFSIFFRRWGRRVILVWAVRVEKVEVVLLFRCLLDFSWGVRFSFLGFGLEGRIRLMVVLGLSVLVGFLKVYLFVD